MEYVDVRTTMNRYAHRRMDKIEEAKNTLETMYMWHPCDTSKGQKATQYIEKSAHFRWPMWQNTWQKALNERKGQNKPYKK